MQSSQILPALTWALICLLSITATQAATLAPHFLFHPVNLGSLLLIYVCNISGNQTFIYIYLYTYICKYVYTVYVYMNIYIYVYISI